MSLFANNLFEYFITCHMTSGVDDNSKVMFNRKGYKAIYSIDFHIIEGILR